MVWQRIVMWITRPYRKYKKQQAFKERLKKLREQDPFIYK
jgi:hypothetical protein